MAEKDVRWIQRLSHYSGALRQLREAVDLWKTRPLTKLEEQGIIKAFEFTHELAWNMIKDFLESRGIQNIIGPKDALRSAYKAGIVDDGDCWMDMIRSRNLTSHTYDAGTASSIAADIRDRYFPAYQALLAKMEALEKEEP